MEASGLTVNGKVGFSQARLAQMVAPQISWPFEAGKMYTVIIATPQEDLALAEDVGEEEDDRARSIMLAQRLKEIDILVKSMTANAVPSAGQSGDVAIPYSGPVAGAMLILVYEQSRKLSLRAAHDVTASPLDFQKLGLRLLYATVVYVVNRPHLDPSDPSRGGLQAVLKKALRDGNYVDVSGLIPGPYNKGLRARVRQAGSITADKVGLLNVPDFPIVSSNPQGWDLAMEILAQIKQNSSWSTLLGRWNTAVASPGLYSRENLFYFLEPGLEVAPSRRLS